MAKLSCKSWEYEAHPKSSFVPDRCSIILSSLRDNPGAFAQYGYSTLPAHKLMFRAMTPKACRYLAGNYRGTIGCLKEYEVRAGSDKGVGYPSIMVPTAMKHFEARLKASIEAYEALASPQNPAKSLVHFATMLSEFLVSFLSIHPYANGNGHMGRLGVWVLLARYNFWPKAWPLEERPGYVDHLVDYRRGTTKPLIAFMLQCIGPNNLRRHPQSPLPRRDGQTGAVGSSSIHVSPPLELERREAPAKARRAG